MTRLLQRARDWFAGRCPVTCVGGGHFGVKRCRLRRGHPVVSVGIFLLDGCDFGPRDFTPEPIDWSPGDDAARQAWELATPEQLARLRKDWPKLNWPVPS